MADRLSELLADAGKLYAKLRIDRDRESAEALGKKLIELREHINEDILKGLDIVKDGKLDSGKLDQWKVMPEQWKLDKFKKVDEAVILEDTEQLADFFANVSNSVIDAQKNLNKFSEQYIQGLKGTAVPPTYFAIPTLHAEMKLGFSELTSRGVNVVIFKKEDQKKQFIESTVSFDLVSTPPVSMTPPITNTPLSPPSSPGESDTGPPMFPALTESAESSDASEADVRESEEPGAGRERPEEVDELIESLREARASLFAATDRLTSARDDFAVRAAASLQEAETPLVKGEERGAILDLIASVHQQAGVKLEDIFANSRREVVVLRYAPGDVARYLVLWPGRAEESRRGEWDEVRVYSLAAHEGELRLEGGVFSGVPKEGYLTVSPKSKLLRLKKEEMADLTASLGDALSIITTVLREWMEDSSRRE